MCLRAIYPFQFLWSSNWKVAVGNSGLGVSGNSSLWRLQLGLLSSRGLMNLEDPVTRRLALIAGKLCWLSVLCHWVSPQKLPDCFHSTMAASPENEIGEKPCLLLPNLGNHKSLPLYSESHNSALNKCENGSHIQCLNSKRQRSLEAILETFATSEFVGLFSSTETTRF